MTIKRVVLSLAIGFSLLCWVFLIPVAGSLFQMRALSGGTERPGFSFGDDSPQDMYLNLLAKTLTRYQTSTEWSIDSGSTADRLMRRISRGRLSIWTIRPTNWEAIVSGGGANDAGDAETMIGLKRLANLRDCVFEVLRRRVPGDLIETGARRCGACIFMRGILKAYGVNDRAVWVADSFEGLPPRDPARDPAYFLKGSKALSIDECKRNFERYELLDSQVHFLKGWFKDTLPKSGIKEPAILRLDGDLYASTMDALTPLDPKLAPGGFVIVDDYEHLGCRKAVDEYRASHGIIDPIMPIDGGLGNPLCTPLIRMIRSKTFHTARYGRPTSIRTRVRVPPAPA